LIGLTGRADAVKAQGVRGFGIIFCADALRAKREKPLAHELRVGNAGVYARTVFLGHLPACGVQEIAPKIRPGAADVGPGRMHGAPGVKKDAEAVFTRAQVELAVFAGGEGCCEGVKSHAEMGGQTGAVLGGKDDAPGSPAAVATAATFESGRAFCHEKSFLPRKGVALKQDVAG